MINHFWTLFQFYFQLWIKSFEIIWYILLCSVHIIWLKQFKLFKVHAVVGYIMVFDAQTFSTLLHLECTTQNLTKCLEKKLEGNCIRMLWAILNKSWKQYLTKQQLYGLLPPISKTIQIRWTRHAEDCWRSRDELISDIFLWTPSPSRAGVGHPLRTYLQQLCTDTGCSLEDLPNAMDDRDEWQERFREIHASSMTRWCFSSSNWTLMLQKPLKKLFKR